VWWRGLRLQEVQLVRWFITTESHLYPDFIPYVVCYSDNACANTKEKVDRYFEECRKRAPMEYAKHKFEQESVDVFRAYMTGGSPVFQMGKRL
jgi:hypothetical protein